ncbi:MAG: NADP-dependent malic enzyme [Myxococcota bacterium]
MSMEQDALRYHRRPRPGKLSVVPAKPCETARELSLAYTPGVAAPILAVKQRPDDVYNYTSKGNLVAVVTNGTAVLGLGDVGPQAAKPVMEGKAVLFKKFADIDVFDIEVNQTDPKRFVETVAAIAPTFGGINLEDIKAPECFAIEQELAKRLDIPVFHDDQHGTAIIVGAALLNALELTGKDIAQIRVAVCGAGAAAQATMRFFTSLGVRPDNVLVADQGGVLYQGRTAGLNETHAPFLRETSKRTLAEIMDGADVFLGLSAANVVTQDMVRAMAESPIIFALANPDPEIDYHAAKQARSDAVVATGRSDCPNQVNNVLGFPFLFRGALDVRARHINQEMKIAAARAVAALAKEEVPETVRLAYGNGSFTFGPEYILPKPFDPRVLPRVAPAVAQAATATGVARRPLRDEERYRDSLKRRISPARNALHFVYLRARSRRMRIVFPEGDSERILQSVRIITQEGIAEPILLGDPDRIHACAEQHGLSLPSVPILDHPGDEKMDEMVEALLQLRARKGMTQTQARQLLRSRDYQGIMMVRGAQADGLLTGVTQPYTDAVRPILQCFDTREGARALGMYLLVFPEGVKFLSDTTLNIEPSAQELAQIAIQTADSVKRNFGIRPRVALLSFSNFGSCRHGSCRRAAEALEIVRRMRPALEIDGEMQADVALDEDKRAAHFPFCHLKQNANVLVCPNLDTANVAYKLLDKLTSCEAVGPILSGLTAAVDVCQLHASVESIVQMCAITAAKAQSLAKES